MLYSVISYGLFTILVSLIFPFYSQVIWFVNCHLFGETLYLTVDGTSIIDIIVYFKLVLGTLPVTFISRFACVLDVDTFLLQLH